MFQCQLLVYNLIIYWHASFHILSLFIGMYCSHIPSLFFLMYPHPIYPHHFPHMPFRLLACIIKHQYETLCLFILILLILALCFSSYFWLLVIYLLKFSYSFKT